MCPTRGTVIIASILLAFVVLYSWWGWWATSPKLTIVNCYGAKRYRIKKWTDEGITIAGKVKEYPTNTDEFVLI